MTREEFWMQVFLQVKDFSVFDSAAVADAALEHFDERFPIKDESSEWIKWFGGEPPMHDLTYVEIGTRDGRYKKGFVRDFRWNCLFGDGDIVKYRVVKD